MADAKSLRCPGRTVLVVDDNETARWILAEILAVEGYTVVEASSADEAMRRLVGCHGIRAVISDIEMPGSMSGLEMAAQIRCRSPEIGVILTSGRHQPAIEAIPAATTFIPKPWDPAEVICVLEAMLAR